jgi:hypothetical protein
MLAKAERHVFSLAGLFNFPPEVSKAQQKDENLLE